MEFSQIFEYFLSGKQKLKVLNVATSSLEGKPNCAPKMLMEILKPNKIYFLEYKHTKTFSNISANPYASTSLMDDANFTGYRLNGACSILDDGPLYDQIKSEWKKRLIAYEADRMVKRITGEHSTKLAENHLPEDFVIIEFEANEAAVVKPDRIFRIKDPS